MKRRLTDLCLMAMMGTVMVVSKEALAFLPNVELVSLLTILFTLVFRRRVIGALAVFLLLEGVLYGFGTWWVMYLYIWPLLAGVTWLFRWMKRAWQWAILSGLFGLAFGTLCSLTYFPVGGVQMVIAWIISGLSFDVVHAGGNFQSPGPAGAPPAPAGLIPFQNIPKKRTSKRLLGCPFRCYR